jgi:hypothetical protein
MPSARLPPGANLAPDCQKSHGKEKARMSRAKLVLLSMHPSGASTPDGTKMSQFTSTPVVGLPQCNRYSLTTAIDGKQQIGGAEVYQTVYWPPGGAAAYNNVCFDDAYGGPYLYDFPFGFPVFIDVRHHFRSIDCFHGFDDDRFSHFGHIDHSGGLHEGFPKGFIGGFHEDFEGGFHGHGGHHK